MTNVSKIFCNAIDSIELGIADYRLIRTDKRRAISAVRNVFSGILLLFKSKLAELSKDDDEALIKQRILPKSDGTRIKWIGEGKKTVDVQQITERFESLDIKVDWKCLNEIQQFRNNTEHYYDIANTKTDVVRQYITKSFTVICSFIQDYLNKDPKECFSSETWDVFIAEQTVYEKELINVNEKLATIKWQNPEIINLFQELLCPQCASFLITPVEINKAAQDCVFQCRSCSSEWTYDEMVDIICNSMKRRLPGETDEPIVFCPECHAGTYSTALQLCLKCGINGPFICLRCGDSVPPSEFMSYEETGLCGYCSHVLESIMEEDD